MTNERGLTENACSSTSTTNRGATDLGRWMRRLLVCNPFYLLSPALLLYGLYRVSVDPALAGRETTQLGFNLGSLQAYEALLVLTAILLARRLVWYDAGLLIGLENVLVLVPFILISQAALIDSRIVWTLAIAAGLLVICRTAALRRFIPRFNLPGRLLGIGALLLAVNVALPIVFRVLHEAKFGTKPDWGAAYEVNQYAWWLLLPLLCGMASLMPGQPTTPTSAKPYPLNAWVCFGLWLLGTGVHLYSLGYIYDFSLRPDLVAPVVWVCLWMACARSAEWWPKTAAAWREPLIVPPLLATVLAATRPGAIVFLTLTILNLFLYASLWFRKPDWKLPLHLAAISVVGIVACLPAHWVANFVPAYTSARGAEAAAALYLLVWAALSRNPKVGLLGAIVCATAVCAMAPGFAETLHWAAQAGLVFLLVHSLRWCDTDWSGASIVRFVVAGSWVLHSVLWTHYASAGWVPHGLAALAILAWVMRSFLAKEWHAKVVPCAVVLVLLSGPTNIGVSTARSAPAWLLAILGSFLLFGLGTATALTRHRWNRPALNHATDSKEHND